MVELAAAQTAPLALRAMLGRAQAAETPVPPLELLQQRMILTLMRCVCVAGGTRVDCMPMRRESRGPLAITQLSPSLACYALHTSSSVLPCLFPSLSPACPLHLQDVERHARAERRLRALDERAGMAVQIEESYASQLQRQEAAGDGLFVVAGFYGRASAVRWLAEELRGGKAVDTDAILGRFARNGNGVGSSSSSSSSAATAPTAAAAGRLAPEEWGCVIDVAGPLQAAVEVTARDSQSEIAVVQLFLPAGPKCGGSAHSATASSSGGGGGHLGSGTAAGAAAAAVDGIWDPCDGEDKALWLRYEFLGRVHEALIGDEEPLKCPLRSE